MIKNFFSPFKIVVLTAFLDILGMGLIIPLLPTIVREFLSPELMANDGFTHTLIQGLAHVSPDPVALANGIAFSVFSIGMFFGGFLFGRLSDKIGRKKTLVFTTGLGVIGYLIFGFSGAFLPFLFGRLISGFAGAGVSVAQAYISDIFPPSERAAKMGMIGAAFGAGFVLGPTAGGLLSHFGLQTVGFVSAGVVFVNFLLAYFILPEPKHHQAEMKDTVVIPPAEFKKLLPIYTVSFLATFGFAAMQSTFGMILPDRFHVGAEMVGYLLGVVGIGSILYQGFLIKHIRKILLEKGMIIFGLIVMTFAFLAFAVNPVFALVPLLQLLFPVGFGSLNVSTTALLSKLSPGHTGKVLGTNASATSLASIFGPLVANGLYGVTLVGVPALAKQAGFVPFFAASILFLLSAIFSYFAIR